MRRERLLQTFGNLTLLTQSLNSDMSNQAYSVKREALRQSLLVLNRYFDKVDAWDEAAIVERGRRLFEVAVQVWPR